MEDEDELVTLINDLVFFENAIALAAGDANTRIRKIPFWSRCKNGIRQIFPYILLFVNLVLSYLLYEEFHKVAKLSELLNEALSNSQRNHYSLGSFIVASFSCLYNWIF